jgi:septation ring formation regulator EzrA
MKNLGTQSGTAEASLGNTVQKMEELISDIEDKIEEMYSLFKENVNFLKLQVQNIQKICNTIKRQKSKNNRDRERIRDPEQRHRKYFQQNHRRKISNLKKGVTIKLQEAYTTTMRLDKKINLP